MSLLRTVDEQGLRPWLKCRKTAQVQADGVHLHCHTYTGLPHLVALIGSRVEIVYEEPGCKTVEVYWDGGWIGTAIDVPFLTEQQRLRMYAADHELRKLDQLARQEWLERAAGRAWANRGKLHGNSDAAPSPLEELDELATQAAEALAGIAALVEPAQSGTGTGVGLNDFAQPRTDAR
jgi:hypothetical protein